MPFSPSQKKVRDRPSNDTDDSASSRNATPLGGSGAASASFAPGKPRLIMSLSRRCLWKIAKAATMPKKTDRNSPRRLQSR